MYAIIHDCVNHREAGYLRRHRGHYDVIAMEDLFIKQLPIDLVLVCSICSQPLSNSIRQNNLYIVNSMFHCSVSKMHFISRRKSLTCTNLPFASFDHDKGAIVTLLDF